MSDPLTAWRSLPPGDLAGLGRRLRDLGLGERAVSACFAVRCPHHAPLAHRASGRQSGDENPAPLPPAAIVPYLFVAGAAVARQRVERRLGPDWPLLRRLGWLVCDGDRVRATLAVLPVADALIVSDRADARAMSDPASTGSSSLAPFCDDSAFHTLGVLPDRLGRRSRWLDVGTGTGVAPLARPGLAGAVLGSDIEPRAIAMAELGAALSGDSHPRFTVADLCDAGQGGGPWDLITFNAPIPEGLPRAARIAHDIETGSPETGLLARFWSQVRADHPAMLAPGGEVVVHSWQPDTGYPASLELPGRVIALRYTPEDIRPAFGVTVWQPGERDGNHLVRVELTGDRPHLCRAALGG